MSTIFDLPEVKSAGKKTGTIFDVVDDQEMTPEPSSERSWLDYPADIGKTLLKGTVEGISRFGRAFGPLQTFEPEQELHEKQEESLNKLLPTEDDYIQRGLRRGLRQAPTALAFPGTSLETLPRAMAAGFFGEAAKDLGAPEWAQTAAELTAYIGPDITKKLIESGKNGELIKHARELGLNDKQITPLIQSDFKQKWLSKLAPKRGRTESTLASAKKGVSAGYETLKKSPDAALKLPREYQEKFFDRIGTILNDMPHGVRKKIQQDIADFSSNPVTGESLTNLYSKINHYLGPKTKQLSLLKEPIGEALSEISPKMGKDFSTLNQLYSKYHKISSKLKPSLADDVVNAIERLGTFGSFLLGEYGIFKKFLLEKGVRRGAQELLLNPRLQQLSEKFLLALNENKYQAAEKIYRSIKNFDNDTKELFEDLSEEDLRELFPE